MGCVQDSPAPGRRAPHLEHLVRVTVLSKSHGPQICRGPGAAPVPHSYWSSRHATLNMISGACVGPFIKIDRQVPHVGTILRPGVDFLNHSFQPLTMNHQQQHQLLLIRRSSGAAAVAACSDGMSGKCKRKKLPSARNNRSINVWIYIVQCTYIIVFYIWYSGTRIAARNLSSIKCQVYGFAIWNQAKNFPAQCSIEKCGRILSLIRVCRTICRALVWERNFKLFRIIVTNFMNLSM